MEGWGPVGIRPLSLGCDSAGMGKRTMSADFRHPHDHQPFAPGVRALSGCGRNGCRCHNRAVMTPALPQDQLQFGGSRCA